MPSRATAKVASIRTPLIFDPGDRWEYGVNTDWVGRLVEATSGQPLDAYFRDKIFAPLGMKDSGYVPSPSSARARRGCTSARPTARSQLQPLEAPPVAAEFWSGGGPLYSTGRDYIEFLQMLLHGGSWNGARVLKPETVALMQREPHRQHPGRRHEDRRSRACPTTSTSSRGRRSAGASATC